MTVKPRSMLRAALVLVLSAALLAALWAVDYLPTNDGPNHILQGYLEVYLDAPSRGRPKSR